MLRARARARRACSDVLGLSRSPKPRARARLCSAVLENSPCSPVLVLSRPQNAVLGLACAPEHEIDLFFQYFRAENMLGLACAPEHETDLFFQYFFYKSARLELRFYRQKILRENII